ncbi:unnamed protein product [Miscanthus lutarioriparius]|uniref:J domain-containing protein n=1 Tax=Miscanthus lutarioriparius TaxID=422564 RepID=A0A811NQL0_9POAL|nr:unnamed protein product [Miscanthus lutarioriparius]
MDPAPDPLSISASVPFPTIPAASCPRPRAARTTRRHAALFRSDHPAAASRPRSGIDLPRRPAASAFSQQEGSLSVGSWGASRDATFVFGSGVAVAPEMRRSFSSGSGEASLAELSDAVRRLSLDGYGRRSDIDAPGGDDTLPVTDSGDRFGAPGCSSTLYEGSCLDAMHHQTEQLDEGRGVPSQTMQCESMGMRSLASTTCTDENAPIGFARSGDSLPIRDSVDESRNSGHGGNAHHDFFCFGGHAGYHSLAANATEANISEVPCDIEAVAASELVECRSFDEKSFTFDDHNVASRNKGGVKGVSMNRRAFIPKKSSANQASSLESVSRRSGHCSGEVPPEEKLNLKEASSLILEDSEEALTVYKKAKVAYKTKFLLPCQIFQKISGLIIESKEYLIKKAFDKIPSALQMISDALSISIYSDEFMAMKAEALLLLQRYEEVIRFGEETLYVAERNSVCLCLDKHSESNNLDNNTCSVKLWRYHLIAKSYFFLGKLEEANQFLKKNDQIKVMGCRCGKQSQDSILSFSMVSSELLRLKAAGNEAFQSGKYLEAVEHYTAALMSNSESLRFLAVCFCNRAAAYQAMGQILDAIADCSLAIALDADYAKAISRRSSLYELIRDHGQAENDLRRLLALLEKQLQENMTMPLEKTESIHNNLNRANLRFSSLERDARKGASLNMYLILGIEPSSSAVDIKKAYRKAALRHHPDKASTFLVRSENISDAVWREITDEIRRDADYLFKIIGKAYAMLSDPTTNFHVK